MIYFIIAILLIISLIIYFAISFLNIKDKLKYSNEYFVIKDEFNDIKEVRLYYSELIKVRRLLLKEKFLKQMNDELTISDEMRYNSFLKDYNKFKRNYSNIIY